MTPLGTAAAAALLALASAGAAAQSLTVTGTDGPVTLTDADIAALPATRVAIAFEGHDAAPRAFEGPLLWAVLARAHAIDPDKPRDQVRRVVLLTGSDGYTAALALGELAPEFEGKTVILADHEDGKPLGPGHLRAIVPGDKRGGRSVHDVVGLTMIDPERPKPTPR